MTLELRKEFEDIPFKEKTARRIIKEVLNKSHHNYIHKLKRNKNTSVVPYNEIRDIFTEIDSEISEDMIAEELRKTREYKRVHKKKNNSSKYTLWQKIQLGGLYTAVAACIIFLGFEINFGLEKLNECIEDNKQDEIFKQTFNDKIYNYGDINNDGIISDNEKTDLALKILKEKGVLLQEDYNTIYGFPIPKHLDGNNFSAKELTDLVKDYKE